MLNFLFAGHDTTANILSWCIYYLARDQEKQEKIVQELIQETKENEFEYLQQCKYLDSVIKEVLRIRTSVVLRPRDINEPQTICGYTIRPSSLLVWSPWAIHHDPNIWPDPTTFDPERFNNNSSSEETEETITLRSSSTIPSNLRSYAYIPFGAGPRRCLGEKLAILEVKIVIATLLRQIKFTLATGQEDRSELALTIFPVGGMHVCLASRE